MAKTFEVYLITNLENGKNYVGITQRGYKTRFSYHLWSARKNQGSCSALYSAMHKHGPENFSVDLIETCSSFEEMNQRERYWIKKLNTISPNGYNLTDGGDCGVFSEETRAKMSNRLKGIPLTEKNRKGLAAAWKDEKIRAKRCLAIKEAMNRPEVRKKTSERQAGKKKSDKHVEAIRKSRATKIMCVDNGIEFDAITDAVDWVKSQGKYPKANHAKILRASKMDHYTAYGYRWKLCE